VFVHLRKSSFRFKAVLFL